MGEKKLPHEEYVMVIPFPLFKEIGYFQGLNYDTEKYLQIIFKEKRYAFLKRKEAESNKNYKQIVPYAILNYKNCIFSYRRGKRLSEERLLGNYSIGVGGHISITDPNLFSEAYEEGIERELHEEIFIDSCYEKRVVAILNDDTNEVGKVHLGIIYLLSLDKPEIKGREQSINEGKFFEIPELKKNIRKFESWSKICIRELSRLIEKA